MTTETNDKEVVFESKVLADDELLVTDSQSAETDIKTALDAVDGVTFEKHLEESNDPNVAMMQKLRGISEGEDDKVRSDGSTASYYELPEGAQEIQDLISHRNMNAQLGEIFRECYRYGLSEHCDMLRGAKKIKFYADAEIQRLEKLAENK